MTEKRFTTVELPKPNKWGIWYDGAYLSTYQVCILLNEYVDVKKENEQLRLQLNNCSAQRNEFHRGARENANRVGKLKKENEQLKKRNENQYNQLTELWQIIEEENWEKLIAMKKQLKEDEERLQREWKCYE